MGDELDNIESIGIFGHTVLFSWIGMMFISIISISILVDSLVELPIWVVPITLSLVLGGPMCILGIFVTVLSEKEFRRTIKDIDE